MADYLPPVVTKLVGDIDDFLLKIEEAKAAVKGLGDGVIPIKFEIDEASLARAEAAAESLNKALPHPVINIQFNIDTLSLVMATTEARAAAAAVNAVSNASSEAGIRLNTWFGGFRLTWNAVHWILMGTNEFLAVAIPAIVAAGAAMAVGAQGFQETQNRMESLYTVTEALGRTFNTTAGQALGLGNVLQKAQDLANPMIWELLGGAINGVTNRSGAFVQMGTQVIGMLDHFVASIDVQLKNGLGNTLTGLLSHGAQDLQMFGQVLGNVGHVILNLAAQMPGLAEILLHVLAGFTGILKAITDPAWYNFNGKLTTLAFAAEEGYRWGGLLGKGLSSAAGGAASLALSIGTAAEKSLPALSQGAEKSAYGLSAISSSIAAIPGWGWALIGASILGGIFLYSAISAGDAIQKLDANMVQAVNNATWSQGLEQISADLPKLNTQVRSVSQSFADNAAAGYRAGGAMLQMKQDSGATYDALGQLNNQAKEIVLASSQIATQYKLTIPQAFAMAASSGLLVGQSFNKQGQLTQVAQQQIANLMTGYNDMTGPAGALRNNVSAVNVQLGLQNTQVSKVNQAWDQFLQNALGGTQSWATLQSDLITIGNVTVIATSKIAAFSQGSQGMQLTVDQTAQALKSFSGTSAQVWQNYNAALTQAGQVTDWWRTAAASGAVTSGHFTEAIATTVAQLMPYAKYSQAALSELEVLSQEAGGPAYDNTKSLAQNFQTLKSWVDQNSISQGKYNTLLGVTTTQMANVDQAAQHFSQTLMSDVVQAVINGSVNLGVITTDTNKFNQTLQQNKPQSDAVHQSMVALATQFYSAGMNAQTAGSIIYQLGLKQHLTTGQAYQLEQQMIGLINTLNKTPPSETTAVYVKGVGQWSMNTSLPGGPGVNGGGNYNNKLFGARGARVPGGYGGGDKVPAMLEPGEAIVPKHLVPHIAGFLGANRVPGFATGGIIPSYSGKPAGLGPWDVNNWNATVGGMQMAVVNALTGALKQMNAMVAKGAAGSGAAVALGQKLAASMGWTGAQWQDLYQLWMRESGWNAYAVNPTSGAAGIAQSLGHGSVQLGNAGAQIAWGLQYILQRYGSPANAWAHELSAGWYDQGGVLPPGLTLAFNGTGKNEHVMNPGGLVKGWDYDRGHDLDDDDARKGRNAPMAAAPAPAASTSGNSPAQVIEVHVHMDSNAAQLFKIVKTQSRTYNRRNAPTVTGKLVPGA